ncbi:zinc finger CCCH domain-containing protein 18 [Nilaparvata lugens]|uniref:zinc finger CCCH domain-containing protein 18 n=1 Tax=Nilaparvata lugens TaxID=108931 RepID=UPI00193D8AF8|nr:zinc finger CCCH domain-containing protein 18 [Nilaparvata lugens]
MDSENSEGEVEHRESATNRMRMPQNICDETSDVSDDENISHAARSIESPPESPQEAGHFESPPASPESDHQRQAETPSSPRSPVEPRSPDEPSSPDARGPRSPDDAGDNSADFQPRSPEEDDSYRRSPEEENRSNRRSPASPGSRSQSPVGSDHSPQSPVGGDRSPQSPVGGDRSPQSPADRGSPSPPPVSRKRLSDSNSDISSNSSFGLPSRRASADVPPPSPPPAAAPAAPPPKDHAEDLSDVSDLGSLDSMSEDEGDKDAVATAPDKKLENGESTGSAEERGAGDDEEGRSKEGVEQHQSSGGGKGASLEGGGADDDDADALDFEPGEEREEGECGGGDGGGAAGGGAGGSGAKSEADEGEVKGTEEELEEGELTDEGEARPEEVEPRPICRFYNRGQCTWGSQCRFLHPGVPDKGNYTMFDMVRPLVPVNGPQGGLYPPIDPYRPIDRPMNPAVYQQARKEEMPVVESAWERGLRQAKEMLRKSTKRKETEVDFEEKKMNLTLSQDELDKENDLYLTRSASPILTEPPERRLCSPPPTRSSRRRGGEERRRSGSAGGGGGEGRGGGGGGRGDEWADPWMRSKSPVGGRSKGGGGGGSGGGAGGAGSRRRKQSYSSGSSYSSSSSTNSSRSSSYSSFSRDSRSRSRSSRSRSPLPHPARRIIKGAERGSGKVLSAAVMSEKWAVTEKARHMNPPPPSPRTMKAVPGGGRGPSSPALLPRNPTPPSDRPRTGLPARLLAHSHTKAAKAVASAMRSARSRSKSSHSSSASDTSGSSSDSSESSLTSSSSSRGPSPSRAKRIVMEDRLAIAQAMKVKAMDALKLSGQKQQIKLTLKGSSNPDRPVGPTAPMAGKKRPLSPTFDDDDDSPPKGGNARSALSKKTAPSRREELLKQLKAVEDAIARKRSKII